MTDDAPKMHSENDYVRSQNNKTLTAVAVSLVLGLTGGYYINENNLLTKPSAGGSSDSEIEAVVKRVIAENPQMLMDSLQSLQKLNAEKQAIVAKEGVSKYKKELHEDVNSPVAGDTSAPHTVIMFFDYHCGYCKKVTPTIQKLLAEHKDVKVIFKEFPILSPDSHSAARAALAVSKIKPAAYFDFHRSLMETQGAYSDEVLQGLADKVGIKGDVLLKEMKEDWVATELQEVASLASKMGIQGTPALIVGNELIPGAIEYDALDAKVKASKE
jgi:protein-disulfide isomerase